MTTTLLMTAGLLPLEFAGFETAGYFTRFHYKRTAKVALAYQDQPI
jgi:hypothetical protein